VSSIGISGHFEPCVSRHLKSSQLGCWPSSGSNTDTSRNSDPYPTGECACALIALPRSMSNFLRMQKFLVAASMFSSNLNSAFEG
jgi:hypothetical protein